MSFLVERIGKDKGEVAVSRLACEPVGMARYRQNHKWVARQTRSGWILEVESGGVFRKLGKYNTFLNIRLK